jgi:hypothetical protein
MPMIGLPTLLLVFGAIILITSIVALKRGQVSIGGLASKRYHRGTAGVFIGPDRKPLRLRYSGLPVYIVMPLQALIGLSLLLLGLAGTLDLMELEQNATIGALIGGACLSALLTIVGFGIALIRGEGELGT